MMGNLFLNYEIGHVSTHTNNHFYSSTKMFSSINFNQNPSQYPGFLNNQHDNMTLTNTFGQLNIHSDNNDNDGESEKQTSIADDSLPKKLNN